jgi:hypothetical protein
MEGTRKRGRGVKVKETDATVSSERPESSATAKRKATIRPDVFKGLASALVRGVLTWTAHSTFSLYIALLLTFNYELKKTGGRVQVSLNYSSKKLEAPLRSEAVGAVDGELPDTWNGTYVGMRLTKARIGPVRIVDKEGDECSMETTKMVARQKLVADFYRAYCFVMIYLKKPKWALEAAWQLRMQKVLGGQSRPGMLSNIVHELLSPCDPSRADRHIDRINLEFEAHCGRYGIEVVQVTGVDVVLDGQLEEGKLFAQLDDVVDSCKRSLQDIIDMWDRVRKFNELEADPGSAAASSVAMEGMMLQVRIGEFLRSLDRHIGAAKRSCPSIDTAVTDLESFSRRRFLLEANDSEARFTLLLNVAEVHTAKAGTDGSIPGAAALPY